MALPDISAHLHTKDRFCHPDWEAISTKIEENVPEAEWNSAWQEAATLWVTAIRNNLGGKYRVYETTNFLILSMASQRVMQDAGKFYEKALKEILAFLPGAASDEGFGKQVALMFESEDDYYEYIMYYYPDGEHPMSGGVCLGGEGYLHYAFPTPDYSYYRTVLVHELTHGCLNHLPLPAWLNEALAMRMEEVICGSAIFELDREIYIRHEEHWDSDSIQQFWSGESWQIPGLSFELAYSLAQVLWRKIELDFGARLEEVMAFVRTASYQDGGAAAFQSVFGFELGELVTDFLGEGNWQPEGVFGAAEDSPKPDPQCQLVRRGFSE